MVIWQMVIVVLMIAALAVVGLVADRRRCPENRKEKEK